MRRVSVFVLLLVGMLTAIAIVTVAVGYMNSAYTVTWGLLLLLLPIFVVVLYRRMVVQYLREVVER